MSWNSNPQSLAVVAVDCLRDLGITLLYAIVAGLMIVAVVASDSGTISLLKAGCYAAILPGVVLVLIAAEVGISVLAEWRAGRPAGPSRS